MAEIFKGPAAETGKTGQKMEIEKEGREMAEVNFNDLERGDKLVVETQRDDGSDAAKYEITVDGKTKYALRVSVKSESEEEKEGEEKEKETEEFTCRMLGGLTKEKGRPIEVLTPGLFKTSKEEESALYFENLKDSRTQERLGLGRHTAPIRKILLIKKGKEAE